MLYKSERVCYNTHERLTIKSQGKKWNFLKFKKVFVKVKKCTTKRASLQVLAKGILVWDVLRFDILLLSLFKMIDDPD